MTEIFSCGLNPSSNFFMLHVTNKMLPIQWFWNYLRAFFLIDSFKKIKIINYNLKYRLHTRGLWETPSWIEWNSRILELKKLPCAFILIDCFKKYFYGNQIQGCTHKRFYEPWFTYKTHHHGLSRTLKKLKWRCLYSFLYYSFQPEQTRDNLIVLLLLDELVRASDLKKWMSFFFFFWGGLVSSNCCPPPPPLKNLYRLEI